MTGGGCGVINGAMILSSIGDVSRFAESSKLLAFASLDPAVLHSVNFSACSNRMSKRGSFTLRYTIMKRWNRPEGAGFLMYTHTKLRLQKNGSPPLPCAGVSFRGC